MQYRIDPKSGNKLSVLGFGCMRFTKKGMAIDQAKAEAEMRCAVEKGVNYFDTAYVYPGSEAALGQFLAQGYRSKVYVATKLPHYLVKSAADMDRIFAEELRRLKTDYIDYYLIHMLTDIGSWKRLCALGIEEWINRKKKEGHIQQIGFSFHGGAAAFREILDAYPWEFCQIQFNYMDENSQAGIGGLRYAAGKGLPVIIMEPLRGGRLANGLPEEAAALLKQMPVKRSPAEWALRWIWDHPEATVVLSGMNAAAQIEENCRAACDALPQALSEQERALFQDLKEILQRAIRVNCTGCGYCMPCPRGVDIPTCFRAFNVQGTDGWFNGLREYFMCTTLRGVPTNASLCVRCGRCVSHCPQGINIPQELQRVQKKLEGPAYRVARRAAKLVSRF